MVPKLVGVAVGAVLGAILFQSLVDGALSGVFRKSDTQLRNSQILSQVVGGCAGIIIATMLAK